MPLTINDALDSSSEPPTSTSTIKTSTADPMLSVPVNAVAASAQIIQVAGRAFKMFTASHKSHTISPRHDDEHYPLETNEQTMPNNNDEQTTMTNKRQKIPYNRLVWFDYSGAGTPKMPGSQYFNEQALFIFDIVILVYDTCFTEINISIIRNCKQSKFPLFIVYSKSDTHIQNILQDLGYDDNDK
ncbi:hypothetical protein BYT27DRAFT_7336795 [Phlegmacium glaucopus]|nr:hypothetical protein BYT27DRAFT_7336795 [Phlegmacium glaucopus]